LQKAFSPRLRDIALPDDVDSGVMTHHRDRVTNLNEFEWLIATEGIVSLLDVEAIKDGEEFGGIRITRMEAGKRPQNPSPSPLSFAE
jgi:hypothetical protein